MALEAVLKKRATKLLELWGWYVVHIIQSNKNGINDTIAVRGGRHIWIEWKREGGRPRELQIFRHKELSAAGAESFVIDKIQDVEQFK